MAEAMNVLQEKKKLHFETSLLHFWQREQDKDSFIQAIYSFSEKILTGKINFRRKRYFASENQR